jgi:hypothetical protein
MKKISYLHFSDLHIGQKYASQYLSNAKDIVLQDLEFILGELKALDIVFFTGDMVQSGLESEYIEFLEWFGSIKECISKHGYDPFYLFVPGNHDLERTNNTNSSTHKIMKNAWLSDEDLRNELIWESGNEYNQYCQDRFSAYTSFIDRFYENNKKPHVYMTGVIPGDFYAEIEVGEAKLGVLGLNSSFLQVDGDDYRKKLGIYHRQINAIFDKADYIKRIQGCDIALLMTHHEPDWYEENSKSDYDVNIMSSGKFAEHLCGHNHVPKAKMTSYNYGTTRNLSLGPSLFGVELKDKDYDRIHGYHAGEYVIEDDGSIKKRFYPRLAIKKDDGYDIDKDPNYRYDNKSIFKTVVLKQSEVTYSTINIKEDNNDDVLGNAKELSETLVRPSTIKSNVIYDGVRQIEREKAIGILKNQGVVWIQSHFGLGEEQFVSSLMRKLGDVENSLFVLNCEGVKSYDAFEHTVAEQYSRPFISLIKNLSENYERPVLMLNGLQKEFVDKDLAALKNTLISILNFNKRISIIITSYYKPSDHYFQTVELKPLVLEDVKHCLEASNENANYSIVDIERVLALTNGYPMFLDLAISELEMVDISDLNDSDFLTDKTDFNLPAIVQEYIKSLKNSTNKNERRCFSLLQLLAFLPKGETFKTISRFDSTNPFKPADLIPLKDRDLISKDYYYTFDEGRFIVTSNIIRVPQVYKEYIFSLTDDETQRDIFSRICGMYFGDNWLLKSRVNIYSSHKGEYCSFAFHNACVALKQLLVYTINTRKNDELVRYLRIAGQFVEQLKRQSFFYVANIISEELFLLEKDICVEDALQPLAYLKFLFADIKRLNYQYDDAEALFKELLSENKLPHNQRMTSFECLGYLCTNRGDNNMAIEYAEKMKLECKRKEEINLIVADYIKTTNKSFDNEIQKIKELNKLYNKAKRVKQPTLAVNIAIVIANSEISEASLRKINTDVKTPGISSYDRMRLLSAKYKLMTSPELSKSINDEDIKDVRTVYSYSFMQMLTRMMEDSHRILWDYYTGKNDYPMLVTLMKYSSFVWEMQNMTDNINEYSEKIKHNVGFMNWIKDHLDNDDVIVLINERGVY